MDKTEIRKRAQSFYEDELQYSIARDDEVDLARCRTAAAMRLGRDMETEDISGVWIGYIEGIARAVERGFEVDISVGEMRIGGTLRTGPLRFVPADKAHEIDLLQWDAMRDAKLQDFAAKRVQEKPLVQEAVSRMRQMGGDPTLIQACPDWFGAKAEVEAA